MLNSALSISAQAHRSAIEHRPPALADAQDWQRPPPVPGMRSTTFQRCEPLLLLHL